MQKDTCKICKHWQNNKTNEDVVNPPEVIPDSGYCLRYPPPMAVMTPSSKGIMGQVPQVNYTWSFPTVGKDLICGEFVFDERFTL